MGGLITCLVYILVGALGEKIASEDLGRLYPFIIRWPESHTVLYSLLAFFCCCFFSFCFSLYKTYLVTCTSHQRSTRFRFQAEVIPNADVKTLQTTYWTERKIIRVIASSQQSPLLQPFSFQGPLGWYAFGHGPPFELYFWFILLGPQSTRSKLHCQLLVQAF